MLRIVLASCLAPCALLLGSCAKMTLAWADLAADGAAATPPVLGPFDGAPPVATPGDWRERRAPALRAHLEREVYGVYPDAGATKILDRRVISDAAFGGRAILEEYRLAISVTFGGTTVESRGDGDGLVMDVALPAAATGPVPVILMETFCPRWMTLPDPSVAGAPAEISRRGGIETYVFGRYICTPPVEEILDRGFAIATIYPGDFTPDRKAEGLAELRRLSAGHEDEATRWGAVAAWGFAYSRMIDALETDPRLDMNAAIAWGHSRYAKAALVAAAWDERIDAVIAHQSGTGGASLNRGKKGESVKSITATYPHWFARNYAGYAGREEAMSTDQHMLLALIAPRPVLLGNARRDVWSDPNGAFRAALGADAAYELMGAKGLDQDRLDHWRPGGDIAFWIRPGTHGVVKEDWPAFFEFLDAHF